jgi:hypothetical protein
MITTRPRAIRPAHEGEHGDTCTCRELAALRAELAILRVRVEQLEAAAHVQSSDAAWLGIIQSAILGCTFTVGELLRHRHADAGLQAAIGGMSAHTIGLRLRRLARHPVAPFVLRPIRREEDGCRWQLELQDVAGVDRGSRV